MLRQISLSCGLAGTCALALASLMVGSIAAADETWEQVLRLQLAEEVKCTLSGTVFVREMPFEKDTIYSGRAICHDGRQFDFSQKKPHMKFEIHACEPAAC